MSTKTQNIATTQAKQNKKNTSIPIEVVQSSKTATKEVNGPKGLEPTRYGDWEAKGRCFDF